MATKKTAAPRAAAKKSAEKRPVLEQAEVNRSLVEEVRKLLKPHAIEVLGHIESKTLCCRNGTVAIVKIDRETLVTKPGS